MKAKIERKKPEKDDTVIFNLFDEERFRKGVFFIYGRPSVGKTTLTIYEAMRMAKKLNTRLLLFSSDVNYTFGSFFEDIVEPTLKEVDYDIIEVDGVDNIILRLRKELIEVTEETPRVVIIDSFETLRILEKNKLTYRVRRQLISTSPPLISTLEDLAYTVARYTRKVDGYGFIIGSGTRVIGGLWKGLVPYKPSYSEKALHHVAATILLLDPEDFTDNIIAKIERINEDISNTRLAVNVIARTKERGDALVFKFIKDDNGVTRPVPLFKVKFQPEY